MGITHNSIRMLPKFTLLKASFSLGLIVVILIPLLAYFLVLPHSNQVKAQTAQTKISLINNSYPDKLSIIAYRNGNDVTAQIKVTDVVDTDGLAGFGFKISYDSNLVSIVDSNGDGKADTGTVIAGSFLTSTGKQSACGDGFLDKDTTTPNKIWLTYSCVTLGLTPSAPTGSGNLATVKFRPGPNLGYTVLTLAETELVDNTQTASLIPHISSNISFIITKCANFDGVGVVNLFSDILGEINRWNMTSSNPAWDPKYDLDNNDRIDLFNDILGTIAQWNMECTP